MNLKHVNKPLSGQSCAFKQDRLVLANLHYIHCSTDTLQSRTGPVQGQKRNFPVKFSHTGKNIFSLQGTPFLITGISLWKKLHKENPVFITGMVFTKSNVYCFKDAILICNLNIFSCFQNNYYIELQNCKRLDQKK